MSFVDGDEKKTIADILHANIIWECDSLLHGVADAFTTLDNLNTNEHFISLRLPFKFVNDNESWSVVWGTNDTIHTNQDRHCVAIIHFVSVEGTDSYQWKHIENIFKRNSKICFFTLHKDFSYPFLPFKVVKFRLSAQYLTFSTWDFLVWLAAQWLATINFNKNFFNIVDQLQRGWKILLMMSKKQM